MICEHLSVVQIFFIILEETELSIHYGHAAVFWTAINLFYIY